MLVSSKNGRREKKVIEDVFLVRLLKNKLSKVLHTNLSCDVLLELAISDKANKKQNTLKARDKRR